jgi:hypothetical protein
MTDRRERALAAEPEPSVRELADMVLRKIVSGIVIGAALIALAIYARPGPPRYQAVVGDGEIFRIDTRSGTILSCVENRCSTVVRKGQSLVRRAARDALPKQEAQPRLPAPAPAAAPAPRP